MTQGEAVSNREIASPGARRAARRFRAALAGLLGAAALWAGLAPAPAAADEIVVYTYGRVIRYDPDVGRELKEAVLVTYDTEARGPVKKETVEVYVHLSDDQEVITPAQITDLVRKAFVLERTNSRFYFRGLRPEGFAPDPEPAPAAPPAREPDPAPTPTPTSGPDIAPTPAAVPVPSPSTTSDPAPASSAGTVEVESAPTRAEVLESVRDKVRRVVQEILRIDPSKPDSAKERSAIIDRELTNVLSGVDEDGLREVADTVHQEKLSAQREYYVLRSFGWTFHTQADYPKAAFFYDRCIDILPDNYSAHLQKGYAWDKGGEAENAIRAYAEALKLAPDKAVRYFYALVRRTAETPRIPAAEMVTLRKGLEEVGRSARAGNDAAAQKAADEVCAQVERLFAPPRATDPFDAPPAPDGGDAPPATPDPFGDLLDD